MIDINKKYQTRDGREVIALFHYEDVLIAHIKAEWGDIRPYVHDLNGRILSGSPELDLIPVPTKVTRWFNVYGMRGGFELDTALGYSSEDIARNCVLSNGYIKTISIEVEIP